MEIELDKLTAFQGPNGAGKSTVIQGLRLAQLGYDPETGKKLGDTRKLINSDMGVADVGITYDTGFAIRRRFGSKTETSVMPSRGEVGKNECQARIEEETGGMVISLDLASFLGLSDEKRREWFFDHLPDDSAKLDLRMFKRWVGGEAAMEDVVLSLWKNAVKKAPNPIVGLGNAIEIAHTDFLEADRGRLRQVAVAEAAQTRFLEREDPPQVSEEDIEAATQKIAALNQRIGETRAGLEATENILRRASDSRELLGKRERAHATAAVELKGLEARIEKAGELPDLGAFRAIYEAMDAGAYEEERTAAISAAALKRDALNELRGRLKAIEERGACPYKDLGCTTDPETLKAAPAQEVRDQIEVVEADLHDLDLEATRISGLAESAREERAEARQKLERAETLHRALNDIKRNAETARTMVADLAEQITQTAAELKQAEEAEVDLSKEAPGADLLKDRAQEEQHLRDLRRDAQTLTAYQTAEAQVGQERRLLKSVEEKTGTLKGMYGNLQRLRAHTIQRMIEPVHQEADQILRSMDPHKRWRFIFERENAAIMDFGFEQDGHLRLYDAASKGERVMLAVAFLGALLATTDPKMRLLVVDDLEQLWESNRNNLMAALNHLQDRWDGVIVCGACDFDEPEGWKVVDLTKLEAARATEAVLGKDR